MSQQSQQSSVAVATSSDPKQALNASSASSSSAALDGVKKPTGAPNGGDAAAFQLLNSFSPQKLRILFGCLILSMFLAALDTTIMVVAMPVIVGDLGEASLLSWIISSYLLTSSATVPLYGKFSDIFGRRSMFLVAMTLFLIGSILCGVAQSMWWLIGARAVQGCGGGGIMSLTFIVVGDLVTPRERGKYMGYVMMSFSVASVAGPLMGGGLTDHLSWRWCFYINIPFVVLAMLVCGRWMKIITPVINRKIDFLGSLLSICTTVCFILPVTWGGNTYDWNSPLIICLFIASGLFCGLFLLVEYTAIEPIIPLRLFKIRNLTVSIMCVTTLSALLIVSSTYLPLYFQFVMNQSATKSGISTFPMMVPMVIIAIINGRLITHTGKYRFNPMVGSLFCILCVGLLSLLSGTTDYWKIAIFQALFGLGFGIAMPALSVAMQSSVTLRDMASATSAFTFFRSIGGAVGVAIYGAVLSHEEANRIPARLLHFLNVEPEQVHDSLSASDLALFLDGFGDSMGRLFLYLLPVAVLFFFISLFVQHVELHNLKAAGPPGGHGKGAAGGPPAAGGPGAPAVELTAPKTIEITSSSSPPDNATSSSPTSPSHSSGAGTQIVIEPAQASSPIAVSTTPDSVTHQLLPPSSQQNTNNAAGGDIDTRSSASVLYEEPTQPAQPLSSTESTTLLIHSSSSDINGNGTQQPDNNANGSADEPSRPIPSMDVAVDASGVEIDVVADVAV